LKAAVRDGNPILEPQVIGFNSLVMPKGLTLISTIYSQSESSSWVDGSFFCLADVVYSPRPSSADHCHTCHV